MSNRLPHLRPSRWTNSSDSDEAQEKEKCSSPPAKKLLRGLLQNEVHKAIRDVKNETPKIAKIKGHYAASLIPEFDPDGEECTVKAWIRKIDQLGEIHEWDEITKSFHLQDKLRGQARKWYNRLESYDYSWQEWKQMLGRAFPKHRDYSNLLEEMMQRKKLPTETMTKYYQDKIALCFRCNLSDNASVSCIIRGLPPLLQPNARAFQCERPDELYEGFLCALDDYRVTAPIEIRPVAKDRQILEKRPIVNPETDPCPRCKKTGHMLKNCTQLDQRRCFKCGKLGHIAPRCNSILEPIRADVKEVKLVQNYNNIYKKVVKVNGIFVKAYIDTGSQVNVLSNQIAQLMKLAVAPTNISLKGFSGSCTTSLGEVQFNLDIDSLLIKCKAHLTDIDMGEINLLIGQPIINSEGMTLTVYNGKANLHRDSHISNDFDVAEECHRFKVVTTNKECLPPGTSIVKVLILGNLCNNNVVTKPRHFEFQDMSYSMPSTALTGEDGYVKVINTGNTNIEWLPGEVLTWAESCSVPAVDEGPQELSPTNQVSQYANLSSPASPNAILLTCVKSSMKIGGLNVEQIKIGPLNEKQHKILINLLLRNMDCFASNTKELGCSNLVQMKLKLTTQKPVYRQPYRLSHCEQNIVKTKVDELLDAGIIKESESDYASPVILVKKKNGDSRLCIDYRALNAITIKDRYPLPNIDDQVSKLAGKRFFTSLDMAQSYHQLLIAPEDTHKTAFVTHQGHYEFTRIPFGLANAPSVFMRFINKLVDSIHIENKHKCQIETCSYYGTPKTEILAFLDDILLPSIDIESGIELLETVLSRLKSENLKLNINKCTFLQNKITYLGHEISPDGIQPGEVKLNAVSQFPVPNNVHEIRQFIGLCSYFRKYINNFAIIARPLTNLTKKNTVWVWQDEQSRSFECLKQILCSKPVLALYDSELQTEIHTDACKLGIAGILLQQQTDSTVRPVMYFSRVTTREESMYHSYELETLAVVASLQRFRVYIVGKHVKVVTDCTAVRATLTKRDLIPRIARWWLSIQDFDISIEYRPGERMRHVDALSRCPVDAVNINRLETTDWFYTVQSQDDKLRLIIDKLKSGSAESEISNNYTLIDGRLYRKTFNGNKLVVPTLARWKIVQMHHDNIGHVGLQRCMDLIKKDFWFPKMTRFIQKYVTSCLDCAYGKGEHGRKQGMLHPIPKPSEPMHMIHIDHLGPFSRTKKGQQYMLVITDAFSKFVIAEPTRTVNSIETIRTLKRVFGLFGYPNRVVTDHGKAFTSRYFKKYATEKQFRHTLNAIACPRANGQVERTNRTILNALRTVDPSEASNNWANCLPDILWGINNTRNDTTGYKPFDLMFARSDRSLCDVTIPEQMTEPIQVRRTKASHQITKANEKMKRNFDKRRKHPHVYKKGDLVLWKQAPTSSAAKVNTKLDDIYSGPYVVTKVSGNDRYRIRSVKGLRGYKSFTGLVAADSLRPYRSIAPISDSASSTDDQLETEDLIDLLES
jgi:hypothetical protein